MRGREPFCGDVRGYKSKFGLFGAEHGGLTTDSWPFTYGETDDFDILVMEINPFLDPSASGCLGCCIPMYLIIFGRFL